MVLVRNGLSNYNADEEFKKLWQESRVLKQTLTSHSKPQTYEGDNITFQSFISNANSNGYKIDYKILGKKNQTKQKSIIIPGFQTVKNIFLWKLTQYQMIRKFKAKGIYVDCTCRIYYCLQQSYVFSYLFSNNSVQVCKWKIGRKSWKPIYVPALSRVICDRLYIMT